MTNDYDTTRYLLELLMHEQKLDRHEATFIIEAQRLGDLIARGHTVDQALDTLPEDTVYQRMIAEQMRSFLYAIRLRMVVIVAQDSGALTHEEADQLHVYLKDG